MPSPRGTNNAGLYIPATTMAYDAAPAWMRAGRGRTARDAGDPNDPPEAGMEPDDDDDTAALQQILEMIQNEVDPQTMDRVRAIAGDIASRRRRRGLPQPGSGNMAFDALSRRFGPDFRRLKFAY
jgi:hypothetical protein